MILMNKKELFLLEEIIKKNFASKYKDSVLGIVWSILKPLLIMILLTIIFSTIFDRMIENYAVFLLSGRCIYDFFNGAIGTAMMAIKGNKNILNKTPTPKYIFVLGSVISEFLNFIITIIILIGVMIVTSNPFYITVMPISIIPIISLMMMVLGLSFILSIVCVYYTDIKHLWGVFSMALMYASAIFYPMEIIPNGYRQYMMLNPLFWIIDQFRDLFTLGVLPNILNILNSLTLSSIILIIGIIIFKKYEKKTTLKL